MNGLAATVLVFAGRTKAVDRAERHYTALAASVTTLYVVGAVPQSSVLRERTGITVLDPPRFVPHLLFALLFPLFHHRLCRSLDVVRSTTRLGVVPALVVSWLWDCRSVVATTPPQPLGERSAIERWVALTTRLPERLSYLIADAVVSRTAAWYLDIEQRHWVRAAHFVLHPTVASEDDPSVPPEDRPVVVDAGAKGHPSRLVPSVVEDDWLLLLAPDAWVPDVPSGCRLECAGDGRWTERVPFEQFSLIIVAGEWGFEPALQAMTAGLPVVTTGTRESRELVDDGTDGVVASPDAPSVRGAVVELLGDPSARTRLGDSAREKSRRRYGIEQGVARELAVYRVTLGRTTQGGD